MHEEQPRDLADLSYFRIVACIPNSSPGMNSLVNKTFDGETMYKIQFLVVVVVKVPLPLVATE
jgi:hypothetical protein